MKRKSFPRYISRKSCTIGSPAFLAGLLWVVLGGITWAAAPAITKVTMLPTRQLELQLAVEAGESYIFEVSTNLVNWIAAGGINQASTNRITVVDEDTVDHAPAKFFRLKAGRYTSFSFGFNHYVQAGRFQGGAATPTVDLPSVFNSYRAWFEAAGDEPYPEPSTILFSGPAGSGVAGTPADPQYSEREEGWYISPAVDTTFGAPQGSWTVNYRGTNMTFTPDLDLLSHLVLAVPTVVVANGQLQSVSWTYRDRVSGAVLNSAPGYMTQIMVQIEGTSGRLYDSPDGGSPAATTHNLLQPVAWAEVTGVSLAYDDDHDNHYVLFYWRQ